MLCEEMGELISAVNRWRRKRDDGSSVEEEIADVRIMLKQMDHIFDKETIDWWEALKTGRLENRIKKETLQADNPGGTEGQEETQGRKVWEIQPKRKR